MGMEGEKRNRSVVIAGNDRNGTGEEIWTEDEVFCNLYVQFMIRLCYVNDTYDNFDSR